MRLILASFLVLSCDVLGFSTRAAEPIRVACVGDSITEGHGLKNKATESYPAVLQAKLGDSYAVRNFGVSGRTMLKAGDYPYTAEPAYRDALAFEPNIVIIKLGTNDTKPNNWKHADNFEADTKSLVASFRALKSKPTVYLCTPVPAFPGEWGITNAEIKHGVIPKIESVAKSEKVELIDLYKALTGKGKLFPDKVHPDAEGMVLIAKAVQTAIEK